MGDDDGNLSFLFEFIKGLVEPSKDSTWVASLGPEVEVANIARLRVHSDHIDLIIDFSISKLKFLGVIADLTKGFLGSFIEPMLPLILNIGKNLIRFSEILEI